MQNKPIYVDEVKVGHWGQELKIDFLRTSLVWVDCLFRDFSALRRWTLVPRGFRSVTGSHIFAPGTVGKCVPRMPHGVRGAYWANEARLAGVPDQSPISAYGSLPTVHRSLAIHRSANPDHHDL